MQPTRRFLLSALVFLTAFVVTLTAIDAHFGAQAALTAGLLVVSLPLAFHPPSHVLGAVATAARDTQTRPGDTISLPVAADTVCYLGALAARDSNGRAVPASDTAGLRVVGRFEETADNTDGGAGDISVTIRIGCFKYDNSATNAVDADDVGKLAVVEDDQTVAETSTNKVAAGRITGVDADGVWVDTRFAFYGPRTVPTLTSTDGTMAAAVDDAATKAEGEKIGDDVRAIHSALFG